MCYLQSDGNRVACTHRTIRNKLATRKVGLDSVSTRNHFGRWASAWTTADSSSRSTRHVRMCQRGNSSVRSCNVRPYNRRLATTRSPACNVAAQVSAIAAMPEAVTIAQRPFSNRASSAASHSALGMPITSVDETWNLTAINCFQCVQIRERIDGTVVDRRQ
jgi:hypothetical protein